MLFDTANILQLLISLICCRVLTLVGVKRKYPHVYNYITYSLNLQTFYRNIPVFNTGEDSRKIHARQGKREDFV